MYKKKIWISISEKDSKMLAGICSYMNKSLIIIHAFCLD